MDEKAICRLPFRHEGIHICDYLISSCSDFRFEKGINKLLRVLGIEESDGIKIPGGIKAVNDPATEEYIRGKIGLLIEAHGTKNFLGINHSNCGDYAKFGFAFTDFDEEQSFHFAELRKAKAKINRWFPGLNVHLIYARISKNKRHIEFVEVE